MRRMVKVYKAADTDFVGIAGPRRKYIADIVFNKPVDSGGFIWVKIPGGFKTAPHFHEKLEQVFIIINETKMVVGEKVLKLAEGDVVLVEPGEQHWFETPEGDDVTAIAIKLPNLKDDKIQLME